MMSNKYPHARRDGGFNMATDIDTWGNEPITATIYSGVVLLLKVGACWRVFNYYTVADTGGREAFRSNNTYANATASIHHHCATSIPAQHWAAGDEGWVQDSESEVPDAVPEGKAGDTSNAVMGKGWKGRDAHEGL